MKENVNYREHPNPTIPKKESRWKVIIKVLFDIWKVLLRFLKVIFYIPFVVLWIVLLGWLVLAISYIMTGDKSTFFPGGCDSFISGKWYYEPIYLWWEWGEE